ncbi:MAG: hypothetical protein U0414_08580 [Polyangiaceae bacterium]
MNPLLLALSLLAIASHHADARDDPPAREPLAAAIDPSAKAPSERCYWMENVTGRYEWVPATWVSSFDKCFAMDSCDGGRGESGGGCYKWADCATCARAPW